ncbi:TPA: hypothetical protein ACFOZW_002145, partial [Neisseria meningitidis]
LLIHYLLPQGRVLHPPVPKETACAFFAVFITPGLQCPPIPSRVSVVKMQILKNLNNHML